MLFPFTTDGYLWQRQIFREPECQISYTGTLLLAHPLFPSEFKVCACKQTFLTSLLITVGLQLSY